MTNAKLTAPQKRVLLLLASGYKGGFDGRTFDGPVMQLSYRGLIDHYNTRNLTDAGRAAVEKLTKAGA